MAAIWNHRPGTAWQKECTTASGAGLKSCVVTKSWPEVPSEMKADPSSMAPRPTAPAAAQGAGGLRALDKARHVVARQACRSQRLVRPIALGFIQPPGSGRIGHLGHDLAGQFEADVILRQHHLAHGAKDFRFMPCEPNELRGGEAGHRDDTRGMREFRVLGSKLLRLPERAAVIPENRGTKGEVVLVEQHGTVHLARETDAADIGERGRRLGAQLIERGLHRLPPDLRILLRPQVVRAGDL
jgi:hypothetical protein